MATFRSDGLPTAEVGELIDTNDPRPPSAEGAAPTWSEARFL